MDEAENEQSQERQGFGLGAIAWGVCALLVVYVLSVGPVAKVCQGRPKNRAVDIIYKPLELLYHHSAVAERFFDWYLQDVWHTK